MIFFNVSPFMKFLILFPEHNPNVVNTNAWSGCENTKTVERGNMLWNRLFQVLVFFTLTEKSLVILII